MIHQEINLDKIKDQIYLVQSKPIKVSIVFPREDCIGPRGKRMSPGVVVYSLRMTKRRCETCKGQEGCIHLSIFKQAEEEDTLIKSLDSMRITNKKTDIKETEVSSDLQDNNGEIDF